MASTYVNDLRLNELATGDASGTWGTITNTNLELVAEAFSFGTEGITTNADTHTSTIADGATDPVRSMYVKYTGTLDSACTITIAPNTVSKLWFIENGTSGSQNIIISQGTGANVTIPAGDTKVVYSDGAGSGAAVVDAFASLSTVDLKVQDDLTVTDDASVGGDLLVSGEVQTANIGFTDGDNAITIADGGGITAANGITSTAAANSFGATSFNDANITNVGDIALDSLSADDSSISIASPVVINGTTPTLTIGDAGEEDTKIVFDGNAQDFYIGLDDSADDLIIGKGSTVGTTPVLAIDENLKSTFSGDLLVTGSSTDFRGEILINNTSSSSGAHGAIKFVTEDESSGLIIGKHSSGFSEADLAFIFNELNTAMIFGTNNTERIRIVSDGKLLIGDSASHVDDLLQIETPASGGGHGIQIRRNDSNSDQGIGRIMFGNNTDTDLATISAKTDGANDSGALLFATQASGGSSTEQMRIDSGGSIYFRKTAHAFATAGVEFLDSNITNMTNASNSVLNLHRTGSNGTILEFFKDNGSVGSISTNANSLPSDKNFKRDITDLDLGLNLVSKLKPSQYNYIVDDEDCPKMYGLIAQDLEESLTEVGIEKNSTWLLQHKPNDDEKQSEYSLDYTKLIPILINSIQEQQVIIEGLKSRIETLEG